MSDGNGVTPPKQPPSLVGGNASSSAAPKPAGGEPRILAGLDGKGAKAVKAAPKSAPVGPRAARKGLWIGVVALLALVVAAGGVWRSQQRTSDDTLADARAPSSATGDAGSGASPSAAARQDTPASAVTAQAGNGGTASSANAAAGAGQSPTQTATIVDTPPPANASVNATANAHAAPQSDPVKALAERSDPHDKHHEITASKDGKDASSKHADKKMTRHEREVALREEHEQERAKAKSHAKNEDPDADILAALFKHTNATDAAGSAAGTTKGGVAGSGTPAAKPAPGSLAAKVEACRSKGFFDGEVCRWQVCDRHWGSDPACPGNQRASATTH